MSGYLGDFNVNVSAWKDTPKYKSDISRFEAEPIALLKLIEMKHVQGLERAIAQHQRDTQALELIDIALEDAQKVYGAMVGHCPSLK